MSPESTSWCTSAMTCNVDVPAAGGFFVGTDDAGTLLVRMMQVVSSLVRMMQVVSSLVRMIQVLECNKQHSFKIQF